MKRRKLWGVHAKFADENDAVTVGLFGTRAEAEAFILEPGKPFSKNPDPKVVRVVSYS